jgi:hypothetical protein
LITKNRVVTLLLLLVYSENICTLVDKEDKIPKRINKYYTLLLLLITSKNVTLGLLGIIAENAVTSSKIKDVTSSVAIIEHEGLTRRDGSVPWIKSRLISL